MQSVDIDRLYPQSLMAVVSNNVFPLSPGEGLKPATAIECHRSPIRKVRPLPRGSLILQAPSRLLSPWGSLPIKSGYWPGALRERQRHYLQDVFSERYLANVSGLRGRRPFISARAYRGAPSSRGSPRTGRGACERPSPSTSPSPSPRRRASPQHASPRGRRRR